MEREGPPRGPENIYPANLVSRKRGPSGEEFEAAELRIPPAELGKLQEVVSAQGGAVAAPTERLPVTPAGSTALVHPMDESGMHLVDLRSPEPGWILRTLTLFRDIQML
jgi:hypothetical protein